MRKSIFGKSLVILALLCVAVFAVFAFSSCSHTHSYTNMSILQVATCSEVGVQSAACECGDFQIREMPKTEHTAGEWRPLYEATCITGGSRQLFCKVCNEVMKTEPVPSLGHDIISYEKREPTCAVVGYEAYEACTRCSHTTYKEIAKLNHTVDPDSKYPTCTEPLLCTVCNGIVKEATGHIEIVTTGYAATCTKEGKTDYIECLVCKLVIQDSIKIPRRAHTIDDRPGVDATCYSMGQTRSQMCKVCGFEVIAATLVSKATHSYTNNKDMDCNNENCGHVRGNACTHARTAPIPSVEATCSNFGVTKGMSCENCGEVVTAQKVVGKSGQIAEAKNQTLDKLPAHTIEKLPAVEATPNTPGLTEGQRCSVCKVIIVQQEVIPARSKAE